MGGSTPFLSSHQGIAVVSQAPFQRERICGQRVSQNLGIVQLDNHMVSGEEGHWHFSCQRHPRTLGRQMAHSGECWVLVGQPSN